MQRQISAGIVIYRNTSEGAKFLFLYRGKGYWNFPKGKIEGKESTIETAFREVAEETGLERKSLKIIPGFKVYDRYFFIQDKDSISKLVIFFLAESLTGDVKISDEHVGYVWFSFREAMRVLKHKNTKLILKKAYDYLRKDLEPNKEGNKKIESILATQ